MLKGDWIRARSAKAPVLTDRNWLGPVELTADPDAGVASIVKPVIQQASMASERDPAAAVPR